MTHPYLRQPEESEKGFTGGINKGTWTLMLNFSFINILGVLKKSRSINRKVRKVPIAIGIAQSSQRGPSVKK
jgi:hypothetical protein